LSDGKFWEDEPEKPRLRALDPEEIADLPRPKRLRRRKAWFDEQRMGATVSGESYSEPEIHRIERVTRQLLTHKTTRSSPVRQTLEEPDEA
jgi:hypothetical protein